MTRPLSVVFQRRAIREIEAADEWWRSNRATPELFLMELERVISVVALMPTLGARSRTNPNIRRVLLRKTRFHLYYRVEGDALQVLALWHAARGSEPDV
jgi:plasmid stabilization system protein ParE